MVIASWLLKEACSSALNRVINVVQQYTHHRGGVP
jgi:hypothetical protein